MAYRQTPRYRERIQQRRRAMREGKLRAMLNRESVQVWEPPHHRARVTVENFDTGTPRITVFDLFATRRIDSYRIAVNGVERPQRMGWSRLLEQVRLSMPRKCSTRWIGG